MSTIATFSACIAALLPAGVSPGAAQGLAQELSALRAATEDRSVSELDRQARVGDLRGRLGALAERGVDVTALWNALRGMGGAAASAPTIVVPAPAQPITVAQAVNGRNLREVLIHEAARMGHEKLVEALEKSFADSFEFVTVPADAANGVPESFQLQLTHVTQAQLMVWRYFTNALSEEMLSHFRKQEHSDGDFIDLGDGITTNYDHPAEMVSAEEADAYTEWLNGIESLAKSGCQYSVMTEAQYNQVFRFATDGINLEGDELYKYAISFENSKTNSGAGHRTHAVSSNQPFNHSIRHMVGNADTWTSTIENRDNGSRVRVIRGGSWGHGAGGVRSARRDGVRPGFRCGGIGFRLVRTCQ